MKFYPYGKKGERESQEIIADCAVSVTHPMFIFVEHKAKKLHKRTFS
jgi:hypothetical protein